MKKQYYLVDVFTNRQFGGNPLAVFPQAEGLTTNIMQKIANELNLSETTFVFAPESPENDCRVRIFTPGSELPMAGHPTIGTAYVLLRQKILDPKNQGFLIFEEGVGNIKVEIQFKNNLPDTLIMNQPLPQFGAVFKEPAILAEMLSIKENQLINELPAQAVACGMPVLLVPVLNLTAIKSIKLKLDLWEKYLADFETKQIMVFTTETEMQESDVHTRFFAPALGIYEDPATGAASGPLGSYLVKYGIVDKQKYECIISEQGFELGRKSKIGIAVAVSSGDIVSVKVSGNVASVGEGSFYLD